MRQIKLILAALFLISPFAANADPITLQVSQDCGPVTTAEFYFVGDSGGATWDTQGGENPIGGWLTTIVSPTYSVATGPSDDMSFWVEHFFGEITSPVTINILFWNGDPLTSLTVSAAYTRTGSGSMVLDCQSFTSDLCDGMAYQSAADYDRGDSVSVPEPGTLTVFGMGLLGLGLARRRKV